MITIHQHSLENSRTAENSCTWLAETEIDRQRFEARSRRGAPQELARALVAAGIPDQPVRVEHVGLRGHMAYPSLHRMAGVTYVEGRSTILHRARYREDERFAASEERAAEPIILPDSGAPDPAKNALQPQARDKPAFVRVAPRPSSRAGRGRFIAARNVEFLRIGLSWSARENALQLVAAK
jgi:hypothetical protein